MGRVERIWLKRAHRGLMDSVSSAMLDCTLLIGGETRPCERMENALTGLQEAIEAAGNAARGPKSCVEDR